MALKYVQTLTLYQAGAGNIIGATSVVLTSLQDIYGNAITSMTPFGTTGYITLEPDTTNEEGAIFTGVTVNANGTTTLTGVSTILAQSPYTATSGLVRNHAGGSKVVVTDNVAFWNTFGQTANQQTWADIQTFSVPPISATDPTSASQVANKDYVDKVVVAGAPNASPTVKGIVQEATQAQVLAKTASGSTGAELYVNPATLPSTLTSDYKVDTGVANAYVITPTPAITAYITGQIFSFKAVNANTTTSALNVNGLGMQTMKNTKGGNLVANDILAGQLVIVGYDGTNFIVLSPLGNAVSLSGGVYPAGSGALITNVSVPQITATFTAGASITAGQPFCVLPFSASAVTLDTSVSTTGAGTAISSSFTVGVNTNRALVLTMITGGSTATSITYAGVALTKIDSSSVTGTTNFLETWYLNAPATGTNNLIINFSGSRTVVWNMYSYYNVSQSGQPEVHATNTGGAGSASVSATPLTNGALVVGAIFGPTASGSVFTNNKLTNATNANLISGDSGGIYPQSSQTLTSSGGGGNVAANVLILAPVATTLTPRAYPTSSAQAATVNSYVGISQTTATVTQTITGLLGGVDLNQTGLTIGTQYYLNDTSGTFGTGAGTVTRKAGIATSATSILITNIW